MKIKFLGTGASEGIPDLFCRWRSVRKGAVAQRKRKPNESGADGG